MDFEMEIDPALAAAVLEIEKHQSEAGWDQPARLYALVDTADLIAREPALAAALGLDAPREQGSITPIEQDVVAAGQELEDFLPTISWPDSVAGCAAVVERLVLPPAADGQIPEDPVAAAEFAREHPDRQDVRIVAGVTRHGASYCAVRLRAHDDDSSVMGGADLVPSLVSLLHATLESDELSDPAEPEAGEEL